MAISLDNNNNNQGPVILNEIAQRSVHDVEASSEQSSKIREIAIAIFSYVPVSGTVFGIMNAVTAYDKDEEVDGWEIADIITQIFSFLLIPQVILGSAYAVKSLIEHFSSNSEAGDDFLVDDNHRPQVNQPQVDLPQGEQPQVDLPQGEQPQVDLPQGEQPQGELPQDGQ